MKNRFEAVVRRVGFLAGIAVLAAAGFGLLGCGQSGQSGSLVVTARMAQPDAVPGAEAGGGGGLIAGMDGIRIEVRRDDVTVTGKTFRGAEAESGVLSVEAIPTGSGYVVVFEGLRGDFVVYHGKAEGITITKDAAAQVSIAVQPSPGRGDPNTSGVWVIATPPRYVSGPEVSLVLNAAHAVTAKLGNGNDFADAVTIDYEADTVACTAADDPVCADQDFRLYSGWLLDSAEGFTQGGKTVSVMFFDAEGYSSEIEFDTVTLDSTDPREQLITLGPIQSNGESRWLMATLGVIDAYEMCFGMGCGSGGDETLLESFSEAERGDGGECPGDQAGALSSDPSCIDPGVWVSPTTPTLI